MKMNRRDFIAIAVVLILSVAGFLVFGRSQKDGGAVRITSGGKVVGTYPLGSDKEIKIPFENGENTVVIKDGSVYMKSADCPDRHCVKQGKISKSGEAIICLPHKLTVEITGGEIDAVAR